MDDVKQIISLCPGTRANARPNIVDISKLCFEMKSTTYELGHFTSISGHSFVNYMNIFHKTYVLLVILRIQTYLKLNWIKSYNMKYKISQLSFFFNFVRKKPISLWLINGRFTTISSHLVKSFSKLRFRQSFWGT